MSTHRSTALVLLLLASSTPAAPLDARAEAPAWVNRGSGAFQSGKGWGFYGVGISSPPLEGKPTEPLGWVAYFRALAEIAATQETYAAAVERAYLPKQGAGPPKPGAVQPEPVAGGPLESLVERGFGGIRLTRLTRIQEKALPAGGAEEVSQAIRLTWERGDPSFEYKDLLEATTDEKANVLREYEQVRFTQSKGTEAILAELRTVPVADLWTARDGTVYVLARLDFDHAWSRGEPTPGQQADEARMRDAVRRAADKLFDDDGAAEPKK